MHDEATHSPTPEQFKDPLANYDPKQYNDPLKRALSEEKVTAIQHEPFECISPDTTVEEAVKKLAGLHIACLLVARQHELLGVFSDRDVLDKVALEYDAVRGEPLSTVMTRDPIYVYETDSAAAALAVMVVAGYRHVPILSLDKKLVGIVSPQRVTEFLARRRDASG